MKRERRNAGTGEPAGSFPGDAAGLRSGELAASAGISKDALRFYERRGLLPAPRRGSNGYRRYPASAVSRVRLIRVAIAAGFSVAELGAVLRTRDAGGAPCRDVRRMAGEKLDAIRHEIRRLSRVRTDLEAVIADWDRRLDTAGPGTRAGLLEALVERAGSLNGRVDRAAHSRRVSGRRP
ncbi:MAG TPA: heavy metal-responsive transcriptional regulator, partial [Thermoanaerobaculia bacterium]|nr:heavy metal-responsive transcriptional regulator [Thermoanaerobaculia bacterium]